MHVTNTGGVVHWFVEFLGAWVDHKRHCREFKSLFPINHMKNTFLQRLFCLLNAKKLFN